MSRIRLWAKAAQGYLRKHDRRLPAHAGLFEKLFACSFEQIQRVSYDDVPMIQLGFFDLRTAHSKNLTGVLPCSSAVFWNVKRV